ncbi:Dabb family protein, partial [Rhizobium ruizarguesonis]
PGIVDIKYGPNVSPEGLHGGFVDGFAVTFESAEARDSYLIHPEHVTVADPTDAAAFKANAEKYTRTLDELKAYAHTKFDKVAD